MAAPIVGAAGAAAAAGFRRTFGNLVRRTIVLGTATLGVGIVTFTGMDTLLDFATAQIQQNLGELPSLALNFMGMARIDQCINIIMSAYAVNLGMMALKRFRLL